MKTGPPGELAKWVIRVDRRLVTLRFFRHHQFGGAAEIAKETDRSTQNVSTALRELDGRKLVRQLEPGRRSWKRYSLTELGGTVLDFVEKELSTGLFERMADELAFRYVRDAYKLVVTEPIMVTREMGLYDAIERVLAEPSTRSAYVVDSRMRLLGMIGLKQMLTAVENSLSLVDRSRGTRRALQPFPVEDYMFTPATVTPDDRLIGALEKMIKNNLEDLPVVDENGILVGELNGFEILMHGTDFLKRQDRA